MAQETMKFRVVQHFEGQCTTAIDEALAIMIPLFNQRMNVDSKEAGDAWRGAITHFGFRQLVFVHNTLEKMTLGEDFMDENLAFSGFPPYFEMKSWLPDFQRDMALVRALITDRFLFDSRPELQQPAVAGLHKAKYLIRANLEYLMKVA